MFIFRFMFRRFFFIALTVLFSALFGYINDARARSSIETLARSFLERGDNTARPRSLSEAEALSLYAPDQRRAGFAACTELFPDQRPLNIQNFGIDMKPTALCSNQFAVVYSARSKTPLAVVERLNKNTIYAAQKEKRTNQFYPDPRLPKSARAELDDYRGSSLDRGHQSPAANQPDTISMAQSFALSNMVPQDPTNNQKIWNKIEQDVRKFVKRSDGTVYVYTGPLFSDGFRTIGANRVWVPTHLYKLVYDESSGRAWAYVLPNASNVRVERPIDYPTFVRMTGLRLLENLQIAAVRQ